MERRASSPVQPSTARQLPAATTTLVRCRLQRYKPENETASDKNRRLPRRAHSAGAPGMESATCRPWRQSHRVHHALDRRLDADLHSHHPLHHASPPDHPSVLADRRPPHDRTVRILLRLSPFHHLHLARQVLRHPRNGERYRQTPIPHRRILRLRPHDSPGLDFHCMVDSPPGRQKLAASAPPYLSHGDPGCSALHMAGKSQSPQTNRVRSRAQHPAALSRGSLGFRKTQTSHSNPGSKSRVETALAPFLPGETLPPISSSETFFYNPG